MSINHIKLKVHYLQDRSYCIVELQIASQKYPRQRYDQISRENTMNNRDTNDALQCLRSYMRHVGFGCKNCVIKTKRYFHCFGSKTQK